MYELSGQAENVDWTDIATAGRAYADNLIGEPAVSKIMHKMADEIDRLRLTEKERNAIESAAKLRLAIGPDCQAVLRGLLERTK